MKQTPLLTAGLFAVMATFALNANAASDTQTNAQSDVVMEHDGMKKKDEATFAHGREIGDCCKKHGNTNE